jgi:hypothetical protein
MATTYQLTAKELKEVDNDRFMKEYWEWCRGTPDTDWHEYVTEQFTERMKELGLCVNDTHWADNYGWSAAIKGRMRITKLMEHLGLKEKYYPLYLDAEQGEIDVRFYWVHTGGSGFYQSCEFELAWGVSEPLGVFSALDAGAWEALLRDQLNAEDWDKLTLEWLKTHTDQYASELEVEYESLTSEEAFIDHCEVIDITFNMEDNDGIEV